jgi:hypothetical protein
MSQTLKGALNGSAQTIVSGANLNALTNTSLVLSAAFSNIQGDSAGDGYPRARLKLHIDSMAVAAGGVFDGWILTAADGSVYEQGGTSVVPLRPVDFIFVPVVQTAAVDLEQLVPMPNCATCKVLFRNNATGATTPANTNGYLKAYYETDQFV